MEKKLDKAGAKSLLQLAVYLVVLIGMWIVIGALFFPKPSQAERLSDYVKKHQPLLVQIAENAMDESKHTGIMNTVDVLQLLGEEHIASVEAYKHGAAFAIQSEETPELPGHLYLIYLPDGQYVFDMEGEWSAGTPDENGALRWEGGHGPGSYVAVTRLADCFFLEEAHLAT